MERHSKEKIIESGHYMLEQYAIRHCVLFSPDNIDCITAEKSMIKAAESGQFFKCIDTLYHYLNDDVVVVSEEDLLLYQKNYPYAQEPPYLFVATNLLYSFLTQIYGVYLFENILASERAKPFADTVIESFLRLRIDFALTGPYLAYDIETDEDTDKPRALFPDPSSPASYQDSEKESQFTFNEISLLSNNQNISKALTEMTALSQYKVDYRKPGLVENRNASSRISYKIGSKQQTPISHKVFSDDYLHALVGKPITNKRLITHSIAACFLSLKGRYRPTIFSCTDEKELELIPDYGSEEGRKVIYTQIFQKTKHPTAQKKLESVTGLQPYLWTELIDQNAPINFSTLCSISFFLDKCRKTPSKRPFDSIKTTT